MRNPAAPHSVPWLVVVALLFSVMIVLACAYIWRSNVDRIEQLGAELIATGDLLDAATRARTTLQAMETGQRGFLLTGNREYLVSYTRGLGMLNDVLDDLRRLSLQKERQRKRAEDLDKLAGVEVAHLKSTLDAMDRGDRAEALRIVNTNRGLQTMEAMLKLLADMRADELQMRGAYKVLVDEQNRITGIAGFMVVAVVLSQLALCYFLLLRYLRQRREAELRLEDLNARLEQEVAERTMELRDLSRHLMTAREDEKARIARELHDEIGSSLTAVNMDLIAVRQKLGDDSALAARLLRAAGSLRSTVEAMRRIIEDLRPTLLEGLGVREAVRAWAKDYAERVGVPLVIDIPEELPPLPAGSPIGVFRIVQEALTNALRHAKASSIRLSMRAEDGELVLEVVDDGVGIKPRSGADQRSPHGLLGIRERANAMGGSCTIGRGPGGKGTEVRVTVPTAKLRAAAPVT
jgi:signal transduction histidine kinase